jgi:uncharacterized membrane protein
MRERTDAMLNGALMAIGALAVVDNIVAHWLLGLHRAVPGPYALHVEWGLIVAGAVLFAIGWRRERRARSR